MHILLQKVDTVSKMSEIYVYSGQNVHVELEGTYPKDVSCNLEVGEFDVSIYYIKSNNFCKCYKTVINTKLIMIISENKLL